MRGREPVGSFESRLTPGGFYTAFGKRAFDVTAAAGILTIAAPVILVVAVMVWCFVGSPVLFRQRRPGFKGEPFNLIKFSSMADESEADGKLLSDEHRLTGFGRLLRATSLDELPELWNVLRGEMSLVGPRPLLLDYLPLYSPEQSRRHEVRPGITGWAQVNGRNALSWDEKFKLDVWYVDNISLLLDVRILALTVWKVLAREGIAAPGAATATQFQGSDPDPES